MNIDLNMLVFGREEITKEERSWLKHHVVGQTLWMPGGMYGSAWLGGGQSPAEKFLRLYAGKGDELFRTFKEKIAAGQLAKRNAGRMVVKGFIDHNFAEITKNEMIAGLEVFDVGASADGWDWKKED